MLGNLIYFHFSGGITATHEWIRRLEARYNPIEGYRGFFHDALPAVKKAHSEVIAKLENELLVGVNEVARVLIVQLFTELCEPDPELRGSPKDRFAKHMPDYSVYRYISKLNRISRVI